MSHVEAGEPGGKDNISGLEYAWKGNVDTM